MKRCAQTFILFTAMVSLGLGCANTVEMRTIRQWMAQIEEEDLAKIREGSTNRFEEQAFPLTARAEPFAALKVLNLPKGNITIKKVEDHESHKLVEVEVGEKDRPKRELVFTIVPDQESGRWLIDDVHNTERHNGQKNYRSIAKQMNLLLAVQEFDNIWSNGDREDVLDTCTARLGKRLAELPPPDLDFILTSVHGKGGASKRFDPKASMTEESAEVTMSKNGRKIVAAFRQANDRWLVDNVAVSINGKARGERKDIPSIQDLAAVLTATNSFRVAYDGDDKVELKKVCTEQFFDGALAPANLNTFPLPRFENSDEENRNIDITEGTAEFVLREGEAVLQISLVRKKDSAPNAPREYEVNDVTIWEDRQEKSLAAIFTAQQSMQVFSQAIAERDLKLLDYLSTRNFRERVWNRLTPETILDLPLNDIPSAAPTVENNIFRGQLTEITVNQGGKPITYVMRAVDGKMKVDDVLFPADGRPNSLKETAELMIPINDFAAGFRLNNLQLVAENSTRELNRMVWGQCREIPELTFDPSYHLRRQLYRVENSNPENVQVVLGDQQMGAVIWMIKERDAYRVDDVRLVFGPDQKYDQVQLKKHIRLTLAQGGAMPIPDRLVVPAGFNTAEEELFPAEVGQEGAIQQAGGLQKEPSEQ